MIVFLSNPMIVFQDYSTFRHRSWPNHICELCNQRRIGKSFMIKIPSIKKFMLTWKVQALLSNITLQERTKKNHQNSNLLQILKPIFQWIITMVWLNPIPYIHLTAALHSHVTNNTVGAETFNPPIDNQSNTKYIQHRN